MAAAAAIMVTWTRDGPAEEDPPSPCDLAILTQAPFPSTLDTMPFRGKICGGGKEGWPLQGKVSRTVHLCGACCCSAPFHSDICTYTFGQGERGGVLRNPHAGLAGAGVALSGIVPRR